MKPSERRALEAEKRAQKEAEARERELARQAKSKEKGLGDGSDSSVEYESERVNVDAPYKKLPEEEITVEGDGYHREGFFSSHVRVITFIITFVLVLTVLGPWGIDQLVSIKRNDYQGKDVTDGRDMTVEELIAITDKGVNMRWADLDGFNYRDCSYNFKDKDSGKKGTYYIREYAVGEEIILKVHGYSVLGSPGYAQLYYYPKDGESQLMEDVRSESVGDFLKKYGYDY